MARTAGADSGEAFEVVREAIDAIRGLRSEYAVQPGAPIRAFVAAGPASDTLMANSGLMHRLARCEIVIGPVPQGAAAQAVLASGLELALPLAGMVDVTRERARLQGELDGLTKQLHALRGRLSNETFTAKAPPAVIEGERTKEREWSARAGQLTVKIAEIAG